MFHLVYASTAAEHFSEDDLIRLLTRCREKNVQLGVTGILLYKEGAFIQALEGEEAVVRSLYATIREDPRHHRVLTLFEMPVAKRRFPDWSMRFENLEGMDLTALPGYQSWPELPPASKERSWMTSVAMTLLATFGSTVPEKLPA